jgi:hypothetical protein
MFDVKETAELEAKLAAITKRPAHWSETPIARNAGGLVGDVERFQMEDLWWTKDPRGVRDLASVNELLERVGVGKLRDGAEEEKRQYGVGGSTPVEEVVEAQSDKSVDEEEAWSEYLPGDNDNALRWHSDLAKRVDVNTSDRRAWFSALGSYVNKFPASAVARDLDQSTLRTMVKMLCEEE